MRLTIKVHLLRVKLTHSLTSRWQTSVLTSTHSPMCCSRLLLSKIYVVSFTSNVVLKHSPLRTLIAIDREHSSTSITSWVGVAMQFIQSQDVTNLTSCSLHRLSRITSAPIIRHLLRIDTSCITMRSPPSESTLKKLEGASLSPKGFKLKSKLFYSTCFAGSISKFSNKSLNTFTCTKWGFQWFRLSNKTALTSLCLIVATNWIRVDKAWTSLLARVILVKQLTGNNYFLLHLVSLSPSISAMISSHVNLL